MSAELYLDNKLISTTDSGVVLESANFRTPGFNGPISSPGEMSASFTLSPTESAIALRAMVKLGLLDLFTTKNADGTFSHEYLPVDNVWPNLIDD